MKTKFAFKFLLLPAIALSICGCTPKKSDSVSVTMIPDDPVVIDADYNVPDDPLTTSVDESETIAGPWYKFQVRVTNKSGDPVTVVAMSVSVSSTKSGARISGVHEYASEDDDFSYLSVIPDKAENQILGDDLIAGTDKGWTFFNSSMPAADGHRYTGTLTLIGWFGDADDPQERFEKTINFSTQ
jgi:hypothetical protein